MHDHDGKNNKSILWMMIPCLLLLFFLFFGGSKLFSGGYLWLIIIGVCVVPHIWMMLKGHGGHGGHGDASKENNKHKHDGCCHLKIVNGEKRRL